MLTSIQAKKLQNLYYNQGLENVRVVHKMYGGGKVAGVSGDGYIFVSFSNSNEMKRLYFDDDKIVYPDFSQNK